MNKVTIELTEHQLAEIHSRLAGLATFGDINTHEKAFIRRLLKTLAKAKSK